MIEVKRMETAAKAMEDPEMQELFEEMWSELWGDGEPDDHEDWTTIKTGLTRAYEIGTAADGKQEKKIRAEREFCFWADQYELSGRLEDLAAMANYYGQLCALYDADPPADLQRRYEDIIEHLR